MKKILLASVLLATTATSAATAAVGSFGGFYIGALGGWGSIPTQDVVTQNDKKATSKGWSVGPQLGYGWKLSDFYLGLDASFLFGGPKFNNTWTARGRKEFTNIREKRACNVMMQGGYVIGPVMPYLEVGIQYSNIELKNSELERAQLKSLSMSSTYISLGGGLKYKLGPVLASLSYRFSPQQYRGQFTLPNTNQKHVAKVKANSHKILLGLAYNF